MVSLVDEEISIPSVLGLSFGALIKSPKTRPPLQLLMLIWFLGLFKNVRRLSWKPSHLWMWRLVGRWQCDFLFPHNFHQPAPLPSIRPPPFIIRPGTFANWIHLSLFFHAPMLFGAIILPCICKFYPIKIKKEIIGTHKQYNKKIVSYVTKEDFIE